METSSDHERLARQRNGIYYTPPEAASILAAWAIRTARDLVLEPSFGACGFLQAARETLIQLGSRRPLNQLYGVDRDPNAFSHLAEVIGVDPPTPNFLKGDFLSLRADSFGPKKFDTIIGNPPYTRHHHLSALTKHNLAEATADAGYPLRKTSAVWAYFVCKSFQFLKTEGRMAWVLPLSVVQASYSSILRRYLHESFSDVRYMTLSDRLFKAEGTDTRVVITLCDGWCGGPVRSIPSILSASGLSELKTLLKNDHSHQFVVPVDRAELHASSDPLYQRFCSLSIVKKLGDLCAISIGAVTGDNAYFIHSKKSASDFKISRRAFRPIINRQRQLAGISLRDLDLISVLREGERCLLLDTALSRVPLNGVKRYLRRYPRDKRDRNITFQKRPVWHRIEDGPPCDAFFPTLTSRGPYVVINMTSATCTNTFHRIDFPPSTSVGKRLSIALSSISTFGQLSAEYEGYLHGNGALKHDVAQARRVRVVLPNSLPSYRDIQRAFNRIDRALRRNDPITARLMADEYLVSTSNDPRLESLLPNLRVRLDELRSARKVL